MEWVEEQIIYVDADQVARVDLNELWEMDIHDHVYAYTPLCTSNPETKGFMYSRKKKIMCSSGLKDTGKITSVVNLITLAPCIRLIQMYG